MSCNANQCRESIATLAWEGWASPWSLPQCDRNVNKTKVNVVQRGEINTSYTQADYQHRWRMISKKAAAWTVYNPYLQAPNWRRETLDVNKRARGDSRGWMHPPKKKKKACPTAFRNLIRQFSSPLNHRLWPHCFSQNDLRNLQGICRHLCNDTGGRSNMMKLKSLRQWKMLLVARKASSRCASRTHM